MEIFGVPKLGDKVAVGKVDVERKAGCFGEAIEVVFDGEDAGVVAEAQFSENFQSPEGISVYGIGRSTVANDFNIGQILQNLLCPFDISFKFLWCLTRNTFMGVTVASNFMASCMNFLNQLGVAFRDPSQDEEGG